MEGGSAVDKSDKLVYNFLDINRTMRSLYEGRGSQKQILILILEAGSITQSRLTERLGIQPGSVSEVLSKLEKAGLIARAENPNDRRTTDILLTEQGKIQAQEAATRRSMRHEEMFSCLTEEEKGTLLAMLEKVNADWRERYQGIEAHQRSLHCHGSSRHHHKNEGR